MVFTATATAIDLLIQCCLYSGLILILLMITLSPFIGPNQPEYTYFQVFYNFYRMFTWLMLLELLKPWRCQQFMHEMKSCCTAQLYSDMMRCTLVQHTWVVDWGVRRISHQLGGILQPRWVFVTHLLVLHHKARFLKSFWTIIQLIDRNLQFHHK